MYVYICHRTRINHLRSKRSWDYSCKRQTISMKKNGWSFCEYKFSDELNCPVLCANENTISGWIKIIKIIKIDIRIYLRIFRISIRSISFPYYLHLLYWLNLLFLYYLHIILFFYSHIFVLFYYIKIDLSYHWTKILITQKQLTDDYDTNRIVKEATFSSNLAQTDLLFPFSKENRLEEVALT